MFRQRLPFGLVFGVVIIGVVSGNYIWRRPLEKYWAQKALEAQEISATEALEAQETAPKQDGIILESDTHRPRGS
eukprot:c5520_g1_i1 orf=92-316(+)